VRLSAAAPLIIAAALVACGPAEGEKASSPPPVAVATVMRAPLAPQAEYPARLEAFERVEVKARMDGTVRERIFVDGAMVSKGQVLFRLEADVLKAKVEVAKARLARAEAEQINARKALEQARAAANEPKGSEAKEGAVARALAKDREAQGDVGVRRAELREAEVALAMTEITAPIDGRAGRASVAPGAVVSPRTPPLVTIVRADPIAAVFAVDDADWLAALRAQAPSPASGTKAGPQGNDPRLGDLRVTVRLAEGSTARAPGTVDFIGGEIDPKSGTLPFRALLANPDQRLIPGQAATVIVNGWTPVSRLQIPTAAMRRDGADAFVLVVGKDERIERRPVVAGIRHGSRQAIVEGLAEGELVVVDNRADLAAGSQVSPIR
jgi:membrane fusion protein (multidrug efflux system)